MKQPTICCMTINLLRLNRCGVLTPAAVSIQAISQCDSAFPARHEIRKNGPVAGDMGRWMAGFETIKAAMLRLAPIVLVTE